MHTDEISQLPAGLGGVYVLMAFTLRFHRYLPFYVGQSVDVARRLSEHRRSPKPILHGIHRHLRTYFAAARVAHPLLRTAVEAALIRRLAPLGNDCVPDTFRVAVNLPPTSILPR